MTEHDLMNLIRRELSNGDTRLFRQNAGRGWVGESKRTRTGAVLIQNPRPLIVGFPGLSDIGGWRTVEITPDMVGRKLAVYVALEVKTPKGRPTEDQVRFVTAVQKAGGMAGIVRSVEDAAKVLTVD